MGVTKILMEKILYYRSRRWSNYFSVNESDNAITPSKMLTFFNSGYKYYMDIVQDVRGRKFNT
jgi:hypothetical protein